MSQNQESANLVVPCVIVWITSFGLFFQTLYNCPRTKLVKMSSSNMKCERDGIESSVVDVSHEIRRLTELKNQKEQVRKLTGKNMNLVKGKAKEVETSVLACSEADRYSASRDESSEKECKELMRVLEQLESKSKKLDYKLKRLEKLIVENTNSFSEELNAHSIQTLDLMHKSIDQAIHVSMSKTSKVTSGLPSSSGMVDEPESEDPPATDLESTKDTTAPLRTAQPSAN